MRKLKLVGHGLIVSVKLNPLDVILNMKERNCYQELEHPRFQLMTKFELTAALDRRLYHGN